MVMHLCYARNPLPETQKIGSTIYIYDGYVPIQLTEMDLGKLNAHYTRLIKNYPL